jgi:hypothetical protein
MNTAFRCTVLWAVVVSCSLNCISKQTLQNVSPHFHLISAKRSQLAFRRSVVTWLLRHELAEWGMPPGVWFPANCDALRLASNAAQGRLDVGSRSRRCCRFSYNGTLKSDCRVPLQLRGPNHRPCLQCCFELRHNVHEYVVWVCTEASTLLRSVMTDIFC